MNIAFRFVQTGFPIITGFPQIISPCVLSHFAHNPMSAANILG
jgi:hypothetical protein